MSIKDLCNYYIIMDGLILLLSIVFLLDRYSNGKMNNEA